MQDSTSTLTQARLARPAGRRLAVLVSGLVLFVGLGVTWGAWSRSDAGEADRLRTNFEFSVQDAEEHVATRMAAHEQVLRGVAALFSASERVDRHAFHDYVAALRLEEHYPGIQGVGFALVVPAAALDGHVRGQQEAVPGYQVRPPGPREFYTSITFLEPNSGRNLKAIGYDMYSEPVRREAMARARDEGRAVLSGKVTLVQETQTAVQAGVLMYLPVYRSGPAPSDVSQRREQLLGWAYMPFRMGDLIAGTLGARSDELLMRIHDGDSTSAAVLYESTGADGVAPLLETQRTITVSGHPWTLSFRIGSPLAARLASRRPALVALGDAALSLLIAYLVWVLFRRRDHAVEAAREMNRELLQAHAALSESELRFRSMADSAPVLIWTSGLDKRCSWFNKPWLDFTGRTMAQELGNGWTEGVHPDDLQRCLDTYVGSFERRVPFTMEYRLRRHDGAWRWLVDTGTPQHDEKETFVGYIGSCVDITSHRDAEAKIEESESRLRLALRGGQLGLWDWDVPSGRVTFNERWAEILGFTLAEVAPNVSSWENLVHPDDQAETNAVLGAHLRGETASYACEHRLRHKDGHWVWILDSGVVMQRAADGTPLRAAGTHLDISERKRTQEALRQSQRFLSELVENSGALIYAKERDGRYRLVNARWEAATGLKREHVLGKTDQELFPGPTAAAFRSVDLEVMEAGSVVERLEKLGAASLLSIKFPLRDDHDRVTGLCGMSTDVTARELAEQQLRDLHVRTARAERVASLGTLAAGMAHEMNNPLAIILANVSFAQEQLSAAPPLSLAELKEALADAAAGTVRVRDLVADLRSFALGQHTSEGTCELAAALDRAAQVARHARAADAALSVELPATLPPVTGSEAELAQLFGCLLVNAGQAQAHSVRISAEVSGRVVKVRVVDTGTGIAPEIMPRIFDPFFTTRGVGRGKGLGLPVALGIAQGLGGGLEVHSVVGQGTTATVTLPLAPITPG